MNCTIRGFPFIFSDLVLEFTPRIAITLLETGIIESNQCFQFFNPQIQQVELKAICCVFDKCFLPFNLKGDRHRLVLRKCRFLHNNTSCQLTNEPHSKLRRVPRQKRTLRPSLRTLKGPKTTKEAELGRVEIVHCEFRSGQHVLKALNFASEICFSENKISRMYSKGIILKNCPKVEISNSKFLYNFYPKIFKRLAKIPWMKKYIVQHRWPVGAFDSESEVHDKLIYSPFFVLICVENSNLNLSNNFFFQNVGRVLLIQQALSSSKKSQMMSSLATDRTSSFLRKFHNERNVARYSSIDHSAFVRSRALKSRLKAKRRTVNRDSVQANSKRSESESQDQV